MRTRSYITMRAYGTTRKWQDDIILDIRLATEEVFTGEGALRGPLLTEMPSFSRPHRKGTWRLRGHDSAKCRYLQ
jgi:hypothetical protein